MVSGKLLTEVWIPVPTRIIKNGVRCVGSTFVVANLQFLHGIFARQLTAEQDIIFGSHSYAIPIYNWEIFPYIGIVIQLEWLIQTL